MAALLLATDVGTAYLGAQGDVWDAQWDMALAVLGCCIALAHVLAFPTLNTQVSTGTPCRMLAARDPSRRRHPDQP